MLTIKTIKKEFSSYKVSVENIDLELGEVVGLIGANGSGKTTLIKMLTGEIKADVKEVSLNEAVEYSKDMSYTPDFIRFKNIKVLDYIYLYEKMYPEFDSFSVIKEVEEWGIVTSRKVSTLSLGESQKLMMEISLNRKAKLYIFDEPSDGYDYSSLIKFRNSIYDLSNDDNLIIISSHQLKFYEKLMDRVLYMRRGQILFNISAIELNIKGLKILNDYKVPEEYVEKFRLNPSFENFLVSIEKGLFI